MLCGIVAGTVGGLALLALIRRARTGGCHGGWRRGRGRGRGLFRLMRALDLDRQQRDEIEDLFFELRPSIDALRASRRHLTDAALDALSTDTFDAARVEAAIGQEREKLLALKQRTVEMLAKLHNVITPEQRERLRTYLGVAPEPATEGPYR
jgi:Spy/CpxP family protein refolding chaperone